MNTNLILGRASIEAAADIAKQLFVGLDGDVCGAGKKALGVSELDAAEGEMATVIVSKIALVTSGAAITAGDALVSDASGKAIPATDLSATTPAGAVPVVSSGAQPVMTIAGSLPPEVINGYALDAATGADKLVRVLLV
ncbi:MAG: DUF2190 family protein [Ignavibacteria bacterium]|jgi:hypothetical protein|nr:DUF2190 family protein [Ignavibacteria bacterium]MCU7503798.1 DUF2190 family protein [Ignavibacteria bacterium]MCU7517188.1 DUF2190 family protein [Ignavibacteria bacterium]